MTMLRRECLAVDLKDDPASGKWRPLEHIYNLADQST
jgi:hypothetical protein